MNCFGQRVIMNGVCEHSDARDSLRNESLKKSCFHNVCDVRRVLFNGRLLLENEHGFVRAADSEECRLA